MPAPVRVAGLDGRSLLLEAAVLRRDGHAIEESAGGRALLSGLAEGGARLVVVGPRLPDVDLPELVERIRTDPLTRNVSILALIPRDEPSSLDGDVIKAGANAVLRRPLETQHLENWLAKLLSVPRRVKARVPVQGHVVGTPRSTSGHFVGLTRNLSVNGILLASPVRLAEAPDLELEMTLPGTFPLKVLGRVVRDAPEVTWPYLGYGVEFLFVPPESLDALIGLIIRETSPILAPALQPETRAIRSTIRRESWIYEILEPARHGATWQVEIRRAPREGWRPGSTGPFYVVESETADAALIEARAFVLRHG